MNSPKEWNNANPTVHTIIAPNCKNIEMSAKHKKKSEPIAKLPLDKVVIPTLSNMSLTLPVLSGCDEV